MFKLKFKSCGFFFTYVGESDALYAWIAKFEVFRVLKLQVILFEIDASIHQLSKVMTIDCQLDCAHFYTNCFASS